MATATASQPKTHDDIKTADLEKVTDYVEDSEIKDKDIGKRISLIASRRAKEAEERQRREKELSKVPINKEDVELIMNDLEMSRSQAERQLREHDGDLIATLVTLTN
ncbi:huntingtin-interacting protein K-like [Corticium candelabrum]|uniref:huntingtin-interacting protein K-like n=1 Tax=Corticium candelabrum TaxID=121492 RepID=UPI002E2689B5|nr:huntingtin-interacting protein K-like [Corticium candelabrum]